MRTKTVENYDGKKKKEQAQVMTELHGVRSGKGVRGVRENLPITKSGIDQAGRKNSGIILGPSRHNTA